MRAEARRRRERLEAVLQTLGYERWRPPPELGPLRGFVVLQRRRREFVSLLAARVASRSS